MLRSLLCRLGLQRTWEPSLGCLSNAEIEALSD
jgi:hypothetical protein